MPAGGTIKVAAHNDTLREQTNVSEYVAVSVEDTGVGIAPGWWGDLFLIPSAEWYTTAGIAFTFHEVATDKVVWSGWKIAKGTNQNAPQVMAKRAPGYTKDIFAKYPPK